MANSRNKIMLSTNMILLVGQWTKELAEYPIMAVTIWFPPSIVGYDYFYSCQEVQLNALIVAGLKQPEICCRSWYAMANSGLTVV